MARAAMPEGAWPLAGRAGDALGSSKKGMSSGKPGIDTECSDSGAKDQKRFRFVPEGAAFGPMWAGIVAAGQRGRSNAWERTFRSRRSR
jgi:hypothetical protein